jgi:NMD protein affecting ribosome stability and mRNA decay
MGVTSLYPDSHNDNQCLACKKKIPITEEFCELCKWSPCERCGKNLVEIHGMCDTCVAERDEKNLCFACWEEPQVRDGMCESCIRAEERSMEIIDRLSEEFDG